jgi:hypothetical protein
MNKSIIIGISFILLAGVLLVSNSSEPQNDFDKPFDVCEEQPTFGIKYQNCNNIECVNFYENIKQNLREGC